MRNQKQKKRLFGFTLIELLVVVAIIALLTSIALISFMDARRKSRDSKRISDMTQMITAMGLFDAANKGFPADANNDGIPDGLSPNFASTIPAAPLPADGACASVNPVTGQAANTYWYMPQGTAYLGSNGAQVYPDYRYYYCLGSTTGNFQAGIRYVSSTGSH